MTPRALAGLLGSVLLSGFLYAALLGTGTRPDPASAQGTPVLASPNVSYLGGVPGTAAISGVSATWPIRAIYVAAITAAVTRVAAAFADPSSDLHLPDADDRARADLDGPGGLHGLDTLGKPAGFVARQIRGWTERWHGSKTSDVPDMEWLARWLDERIPADPARPTLVHGDYKLDNVMWEPELPIRIQAIVDWEVAGAAEGVDACREVRHLTGFAVDPRAQQAAFEGCVFVMREGIDEGTQFLVDGDVQFVSL